MSRSRVLVAALLASSATALVGVAPASSQTGPPTVSISPIEGPIGTEITATIANCTPPTMGEARLDFSFVGFTPAHTVFFSPAADGTATATIEATEKEGQSENLTAAEVVVSQCGNEGFDRAPFTVTRFPTIGKPAVVRGNTWFLRNSNTTGTADFSFVYGNPGDLPLFGDWDGTGPDGPGVVRSAVWYLRCCNETGVATVPPFTYGNSNDFPISGRWVPGTVTDTVGVVRGNNWFLRNSNTTGTADLSFAYGNSGDFPIVGDWDGDGIDTPGVVRGNRWFLRNSNSTGVADIAFTYGNSGDLPIVGDWDTNDTETPGVVRGNVRFLRNSNSAGVADVAPFAYGNASDEHMVWTAAPG